MSERLLLELEGGGRPPAELPRAGTLVLGSSKERAGFVIEGGGVGGVHAAIGRRNEAQRQVDRGRPLAGR